MNRKTRQLLKFACPECGKALIGSKAAFTCRTCGNIFLKADGKPCFLPVASKSTNSLDRLKSYIKKYSKAYNMVVKIFSPVMSSGSLSKFLRQYYKKSKLCLNLGSGNLRLSEGIINVDIFDYDNVDVIADVTRLPFQKNTIDVVVSTAVLEHVPDPKKVVDEVYRVLKPGGIFYCYFPFIQGFHASPYDYSRMTKEGLKNLFAEYKIMDLRPSSGPTSGMLWIFQEWVAIAFSFGFKPLHHLIYFLTMLATFPVKLLDLILIRYSSAENISSAFAIIGKKP